VSLKACEKVARRTADAGSAATGGVGSAFGKSRATRPAPSGDPPVHVSFLSTYPPRACGLATFTQDLRAGVHSQPGYTSDVVAVVRRRGPQQPEVAYQLLQHDRDDYTRCAEWLNATGTDAVCLQHEFGIFGGSEGAHVLDLLDGLRRPVATTFHTVLPAPPEHYLRAARAVIERSDRLIATTATARSLLSDVYGADPARITIIPHGSPDLDPTPDPDLKRRLGADGRTLLLTFGLLGPGKGIEHAIASLPTAVEARPDVLYVVLGATHPDVVEREGEAYRERLQAEVRRAGLENHVRFVNRYTDLETVWSYLKAADVFVSPYPGLDQICSGTLAYALGAGKPVVATPYLHARDVLVDGRGLLASADDPAAFGEALATVCADAGLRESMAARALEYGRETVWPRVGEAYSRVFADAAASAGPARFVVGSDLGLHPAELPAAVGYLADLTDDTGIVQHAAYGVPDRNHGYSTDDAARALVVVVRADRDVPAPVAARLTRTYLAFLFHAQRDDHSFYNFLDFERRFLDIGAGEDTLTRALWGLGVATARSSHGPWRVLARQLFERSMHLPLVHPRAMGYALLGLDAYLSAYPGADAARDRMAALANDLVARLRAHERDGWTWPADDMTYANAIIPHGVLRAGVTLGDESLKSAGLEMLEFLAGSSFRAGRFDAVGNEGWWHRDGAPAAFDQQPIEAGYMADACAFAWFATRDPRWAHRARVAAEWFYGGNRLGACLFDVETGACFDGLTTHGVNQNQGAESTIACALALLAVNELDAAGAPGRSHAGAGGDGSVEGAPLRAPQLREARPAPPARRTTDEGGLASRT